MTVMQKGRLDDLEEAHEIANHINALVGVSEENPQTLSDAIIRIMEGSSESQETEPEVVSELEEENFRIDSTGWEARTDDDGVKYKLNPEGDITEILEWEFAGEQHFQTQEAALRETKKAGKKIPNNIQWGSIIQAWEKIAQENNIPLHEVLKLKLAGTRYWNRQYYGQGLYGNYWSSSTATHSYRATFDADGGGIAYNYHCDYGFSVRCLKN